MPYLYEIDNARDDNPLLAPPMEGVDYTTCWTCIHFERIAKASYPVNQDIGYCKKFDEVVTDPHEEIDCDEWASG